MSLSEEIRTTVAARAAADPDAAKLLESFRNAHQDSSERSMEPIGDVEIPKLVGSIAMPLARRG